ncbi:RidA family protein [Halobacillus mangrovi]|uniref:RidA family protein n=1 Tax=Halobacillus mangrovi TaxID=402384 RepID=UPI003D962297
MIKQVKTKKAPSAVGPYSQAVISNGQVYLSGMLPLNSDSGEITGDTVAEQTKQILDNITGLLEEINLHLTDVIKTTIFLDSMNDFQQVNDIYGDYFSNHKPARSCVEVSAIPKGALIEIEVIAQLN